MSIIEQTTCNMLPPKLFPHNQVNSDLLRMILFVSEEYSEAVLAGIGMSSFSSAWGKMPIFYVVIDGKCFCLYYLLLLPLSFSNH